MSGSPLNRPQARIADDSPLLSWLASRMTQGIFVGHHDRTGAVLCVIKDGVREPLDETVTQ